MSPIFRLFFLTSISWFSKEIEGDLRPVTLYNIDIIGDTDLLTGIAYQLVHPENPHLFLSYNKRNKVFQYSCAKLENPCNKFYLWHAGSGFFFLKNAAFPTDVNVVARCENVDSPSGTRICNLTQSKLENPNNYWEAHSWYRPTQLIENEDSLPPRLNNVYRLDYDR